MKRLTAQLSPSVLALADIIHADVTASHRARGLLKDRLAMRQRERHTWCSTDAGKARKWGRRESWQWEVKAWHFAFHTILVLIWLIINQMKETSLGIRCYFLWHRFVFWFSVVYDFKSCYILLSWIWLLFYLNKVYPKTTKDTVIRLSVWQMRYSFMWWKIILRIHCYIFFFYFGWFLSLLHQNDIVKHT